jgi:hypothetical protein
VGPANAETAAPAELEAPDSADAVIGDPAPTARDPERLRELRKLRERAELKEQQREQRREEWWIHARSVLFSDIPLSAEQSREVDAIIEAQLDGQSGRKGPTPCIEKLRALLSEEQHPTFDMNRARLAAEGQQETGKGRRRRRPPAGAEVKAE